MRHRERIVKVKVKKVGNAKQLEKLISEQHEEKNIKV